MEILWETLSFAAKGLVVFVTVAACAAVIFSRARGARSEKGSLLVKKVNDRFDRLRDAVRQATLSPREYKRHRRQEGKRRKKLRAVDRARVFVLDFDGDLLASPVANLREEISAILGVARPNDEVVVRLESPGGIVHTYGLAASQLERIRAHDLRLTVCVDKVAASGGYMMACVADRILAAPFAIIGSIGVLAPVPNAHRLLERMGVDYDEMSAGEYKRTVSLFGEITDAGRAKYQQQLEDVHELFKDFVQEHRSGLKIDDVATGEHWYGKRAIDIGLVDELITSDDYLSNRLEDADLYSVHFQRPRTIKERVAETMSIAAERLLLRLWSRSEELKL